MTIAELIAELSKYPPELSLTAIANDSFCPVVGVSPAPEMPYVILRCKGRKDRDGRFSAGEEGLLGHLIELGLTDEQIAESFGRDIKNVQRKRKSLVK